MDAEENQQQVSHGAHSPWKSLRDSHIPTAATSNGKVENQKQVSHFPTAYGSCLTKTERRPGCGASLLLQAHRSIRKCYSGHRAVYESVRRSGAPASTRRTTPLISGIDHGFGSTASNP